MLDDHRRLLLVDEPRALGDELLGVLPELGERRRLDPAEDVGDGPSRELRLLGDLADEVVLHL